MRHRRIVFQSPIVIEVTNSRWLGCSVCGLTMPERVEPSVERRTRFRHWFTSRTRWHRRAWAVWCLENLRDPLTGRYLTDLDLLATDEDAMDVAARRRGETWLIDPFKASDARIPPYTYLAPEDYDPRYAQWRPQGLSAVIDDIIACERYLAWAGRQNAR